MDVGTSVKISKGLIKIQTAVPVSYTEKGLLLDNGTELDADVIVFTTGFEGNMKYLVKDLFGEEIAEQMGDFWGLDEEGEIKGAWKANREFLALELAKEWLNNGKLTEADPAMWYHGGTLGLARYYSRFIALQIKAKLLGIPLAVYDKIP